MNHIKLFESFSMEDIIINANRYDIQFNSDRESSNGNKISIVGKTIKDVLDIYNRTHQWLDNKNIPYKIATRKRIEHSNYEQSKKIMTVYVPDDMDNFYLMLRLEYLLKGYTGWHDIKLPFKGYEHYSNGIFFRNDRDNYGNYIPANQA